MTKINDITGRRFGMLTAIERTSKRTAHRNIVWRCLCDCGNEIEIGSNALVSGNTRSCGCLRNGGVGGGIGGGKPIDITGQRFGKLVAIKRIGRNEERDSLWLFKCDCGNTCVKNLSTVKSGNVTSCGCKYKPYDHRLERLHAVYHGMKARCYQPNHVSYKWYGAKGVKVCKEWLDDFNVFAQWAIESGYDITAPRGCCTIDRIDPYKDYEPSNCRWISMADQQLNKRREVS